jgi:DNA-binding GntR family transcriptional regulator
MVFENEIPNLIETERTTVVTALYKEIRQAIIEGRIPSGTRLNETQIANQFGTSRTPIRETLLLLRGDGLVTPLLSGGVVVSPIDREKDIIELYDLRIALEGYAAYCAAERANDDDIQRLHAICDELEDRLSYDSPEALLEIHKTFEQAVIAAVHNERLVEYSQKLNSFYFMKSVWLQYDDDEFLAAYQRQRDLAEAIRQRNATEAEALRREALKRGREIALALNSEEDPLESGDEVLAEGD